MCFLESRFPTKRTNSTTIGKFKNLSHFKTWQELTQSYEKHTYDPRIVKEFEELGVINY
jgi:hypothetical protein